MRKLLCLMLTLLILPLAACNKNENKISGAGAALNKPAPEITFKAMDGSDVKLSDFRGKVVMLNFWATWCPPCREEIPSMMKLNSRMAGKPFQMLAVSIDEGGRKDVEEFFRRSGFSLPAYTDQNRKAAAVYGVTGVPETFIIDPKGTIVKKVIGPLNWEDSSVSAYLQSLMN